MRIGLTYDLRDDYLAAGYDELDTAELDSTQTIDALKNAIQDLGHDVQPIGNLRALAHALVHGERWELVFNICEGLRGFGRESQVPALLEAYDIPYTFSDPLVCALALHKAMAKHVVRGHHIATPDFVMIDRFEQAMEVELPFPLFVKPVGEGTSKGITPASLVQSRPQLTEACEALLTRYRQPVLIERFLPGREFTVGILGSGTDAGVLAVMEISPRPHADQQIYSFDNKARYQELVDYRLVADSDVGAEVNSVALGAWRCLGCRDAGRVDVRLDEYGHPQFLEVNPLAGLNALDSDLPIMAKLKGMSYSALIGEIIDSAVRRLHNHQRPAASAA